MLADNSNFWFQVALDKESERHFFTSSETEAWQVAEEWSTEEACLVSVHLYCDAERRHSWSLITREEADGSAGRVILDEAM